jgi:DHA1 family bicyclomycin/chloramphenicol resistance-like MFS transporter
MTQQLFKRLPARVGSGRWVVSLAALTAITALSIDMSLPAQPAITRAFAVGSPVGQLTLSLFLLGFAIGQLVSGYLSDARGRRPVLLVGLIAYTVAGLACSASLGIGTLLVCRFVQGLAASAAPVIARAMVRDTHEARKAARVLSTMVAVLAVAPMLAPVIGGFVLELVGWRAIYGTLAGLGVLFTAMAAFTLPETLVAERRATLSLPAIGRGFATFLRTPGTLPPTLVGCASFAGQFAFISDSPFVLMEHYGVSPGAYGFYFGATAVALLVGAWLSSRLLEAGFGPRALLRLGGSALLLGGCAVCLGVRLSCAGVIGLIAPMIVYFVGLGLLGPSATAIAMDPVPEIAGTASSIIGFLQMTSGALSGYVTTRVGGRDPRVLGFVIGAMGLLGAALAIGASRARR